MRTERIVGLVTLLVLLGLLAVLGLLAILPLLGLLAILRLLGLLAILPLLGLLAILRLLGTLLTEGRLTRLEALLLAVLARLAEGTRGCIHGSNLAGLELEEQNAARSTHGEGEEGEQERADRQVAHADLDHGIDRHNDREECQENRPGTRRDERPLLVREPVGDTNSDGAHKQEGEGNREPAAAAKERLVEAEEGDVGQDHRNEDQESRNADADQRVGRANGTTTDLTGLGNNGVLELVEGRIRGGAELLSGSSKLLTGGLTGLPLRGLATRRPRPAWAFPGGGLAA